LGAAREAVPLGAVYVGMQGAISYVTYFLSYAALTRILTPLEVGKLPLLNAVYAAYQTVTMLGLQFAVVKFTSEFASSGKAGGTLDVVRSSLKLVGVTSVCGLAIVALLSQQLSELILGSTDAAGLLVLLVLSDLVSNFGAIFVSVLWGLSSFRKMVASNLAGTLLGRISGILLAWVGFGLLGFVAGWVIGYAMALALAILFVRPHLTMRGHLVAAREMLEYSYPILLSSLVGLVLNWADVAILFALSRNFINTGIYYLGFAGSGILSLFATALTWAIFPTLSALFGRGETEPFKEVLRSSQRLLAMVIMPTGAALATVASTAVTLAYGRAYYGAAAPFAILVASSILPAYLSLMTFSLLAIGRTNAMIRISGAAALTEIALTITLVPQLNVVGSAVARAAMSAVGLLVSYVYVRGLWWPKIERTSLAKSSMLTALVVVVLFAFDSVAIREMRTSSLGRGLLDVVVFLLVYADGLFLLKPLVPRDIEMLGAVLPVRLQGWLPFIQRWLVA